MIHRLNNSITRMVYVAGVPVKQGRRHPSETLLSNPTMSHNVAKQGVSPTINIKFFVLCEYVGYHICYTNRAFKNSTKRYRLLYLCF